MASEPYVREPWGLVQLTGHSRKLFNTKLNSRKERQTDFK